MKKNISLEDLQRQFAEQQKLKNAIKNVGNGKVSALDIALANANDANTNTNADTAPTSLKQQQFMNADQIVQAAEKYRAENNIPKNEGTPTTTPSQAQKNAFQKTAYRMVNLDDETDGSNKAPGGETDTNGSEGETDTASSSVVADAESVIDSMIEKIKSGRTSYSDKLDNLLSSYLNRGQFKYDPNADMLYQNYLTAMQNAGQMAMKDTMGQAAMLTGGYGSSYATAAANGAYNNYLQQANNALPDYYNIAANAYDREGNDMLSQINLLRNQDDEEYNRYVTALQTELNRDNELYNRQQAEIASQAASNSYNNMSAAQQNAVWNGALDAALGTGGIEAAEKYLLSLPGYNITIDVLNQIRDYINQNTVTLRKARGMFGTEAFTDGTYNETGELNTWTAKQLLNNGIITREQYDKLVELDNEGKLDNGGTYTFKPLV